GAGAAGRVVDDVRVAVGWGKTAHRRGGAWWRNTPLHQGGAPRGAVEVVGCQSNLFEVVLAGSAGSGCSPLLDGWQQQADENGDDGNHHQELNQREAALSESLQDHRHTITP